jgi:osmotically-inducible protein OsmY
MRDSEIEQWVLNEIRLMTDGRLKEVCVLSLEGLVQLKGTVPNRADKLAAQNAAQQSRGVVGVINQLHVRRRNLVRRPAAVKSQVVPVPSTFPFPDYQDFRSPRIAS